MPRYACRFPHVLVCSAVNKKSTSQDIAVPSAQNGLASCVEVNPSSKEPGFDPIVVKSFTGGKLNVGGFGVCVVTKVQAK